MIASAEQSWCEEKTTMLLEYQRTTEVYSRALAELVQKIGVVSKAEYERLHQVTEEARHESTAKRERLDQHITEHHC